MKKIPASGLILLAFVGTAIAQPPDEGGGGGTEKGPLDWRSLETPILSRHIQLTSRDMFTRAGEAYFSPDANWIIFQATPVPPEGKRPSEFYSMYVAKLCRDPDGTVTGLEDPILISPPGSANTCGWFHPQFPWRVLFGSTLVPPDTDQRAGFQVGTRRYTWLFPQETDIVTRTVVEMLEDAMPGGATHALGEDAAHAVPLITAPDYVAEGSWSPCGRFILYAAVRPERTGPRPDVDIWIYDSETEERHLIVRADGYDGGPFFSPDGTRICYRSDRKRNDRLQLFVADLKFEDGVPVGIEREYQLTDNEHVNWAPFWHPSGDFIVYGSSEIGHWNYEIFAIQANSETLRAGTPHDQLWRKRITFADGADILPVFSPDGRFLMWTAQRGPLARGEDRPSSQLWIAAFDLPSLTSAPLILQPLTEEQAIEIARGLLAEDEIWAVAELQISAHRMDGRWLVHLIRLPAAPGNDRFIEVEDDGTARWGPPGR